MTARIYFYVRLEPAGSEAYVELTNLLISRWPALNFTRSEVNATHELLFHVDTEITLSRISKTEYNHAIKGTATLQVTSASTQIITHSNRLSITYQNRIHASKDRATCVSLVSGSSPPTKMTTDHSFF